MTKHLLFSVFALCFLSQNAISQAFFNAQAQDNFKVSQDFNVTEGKFEIFQLDQKDFVRHIEAAPLLGNNKSNISLTLPTIGGEDEFYVYESPCMMDEISARYPHIKSYKIVSKTNPARNGRIALGKSGIAGVMHTANGTVYFDPIDQNNTNAGYIFYYASDQIANVSASNPQLLSCGYEPNAAIDYNPEDDKYLDSDQALNKSLGALAEVQTYRMAIAATGEFTNNIAGGNIVTALERIHVTVNRLNQIFENELAIRIVLINQNDQIIWDTPVTDPFTNGQLGGMTLGQATTVINSTINALVYDWGHVYTGGCTDGVAGIANLGVVCNTANKANGVTCFSNANVAAVAVRVTAHEMGHQMTAPHSWNACQEGQQHSGGDDFEPGSGSTIMSYAGLCGSNNVQGTNDDYFHSGSLKNIYQFMRDGQGSSCPTKTDLGNHAPDITLNYESGFYIPISTPFELEGEASDSENDQLTYIWEQRDSFLSQQPLGEPFGRSPLFRSLYPSEDTKRTFPRLDRVLNNTSDRTEVLPTYSRLMSFAFVVRDNHFEGGIASEAHVRFFATEEAGPFMVSSQNNFESYQAGDKIIVEWDVANTDREPVNTAAVDILLSTDGGQNFDYVLSNTTANDGIEEVFLPQVESEDCRIKIKPSENIYFDINDFNFDVTPATDPGFILSIPQSYFNHCAPEALNFDVGAESFLGFDSQLELSLVNPPAELIYNFEKTQISSDETTNLNLDFSNYTAADFISFDVQAVSADQDTLTKNIQIKITSTDFSSLSPLVPTNGATAIGETPFFKWSGSTNADSYIFQLSTNPKFEPSNTREVVGLNQDSILLAELLEKSTIYYWRLIPVNACGFGQASEINAFSTLTLGCFTENATDLPKNITQSGSPEIESNIFITSQGTIADVNVKDVSGIHEDVADLRISLISPSGTEVKLVTNKCFGANFDCGFDDQAGGPVACPLSSNQTYRPEGDLSDLIDENWEGEWTLRIKDSASGAGGQFNNFQLNICGGVTTEAPYLVYNTELVVHRWGSNRIADWRLKAEDANNSASELTYTLVTIPVSGVITKEGEVLAVGDQFTQQDVNNSEIWYEHGGDNAFSDGFDFTVIDGEGGWIEITHYDIVIEGETTGSNDILTDEKRFDVFPVPTKDLLYLKQATHADFEMELFDQTGRLLKSQLMHSSEEILNISELNDGHYFIKLTFDTFTQVEKIIKI